jgi:DNA-binding HxlR family transcriptional regulator
MSTLQPNILSVRCPSRKVLELLADKWSVLIIAALTRGINRNGELLREIGGISQKMLTQTLRALERDCIVQRKVYPASPPKVEYELTDRYVSTLLRQP